MNVNNSSEYECSYFLGLAALIADTTVKAAGGGLNRGMLPRKMLNFGSSKIRFPAF